MSQHYAADSGGIEGGRSGRMNSGTGSSTALSGPPDNQQPRYNGFPGGTGQFANYPDYNSAGLEQSYVPFDLHHQQQQRAQEGQHAPGHPPERDETYNSYGSSSNLAYTIPLVSQQHPGAQPHGQIGQSNTDAFDEGSYNNHDHGSEPYSFWTPGTHDVRDAAESSVSIAGNAGPSAYPNYGMSHGISAASGRGASVGSPASVTPPMRGNAQFGGQHLPRNQPQQPYMIQAYGQQAYAQQGTHHSNNAHPSGYGLESHQQQHSRRSTSVSAAGDPGLSRRSSSESQGYMGNNMHQPMQQMMQQALQQTLQQSGTNAAYPVPLPKRQSLDRGPASAASRAQSNLSGSKGSAIRLAAPQRPSPKQAAQQLSPYNSFNAVQKSPVQAQIPIPVPQDPSMSSPKLTQESHSGRTKVLPIQTQEPRLSSASSIPTPSSASAHKHSPRLTARSSLPANHGAPIGSENPGKISKSVSATTPTASNKTSKSVSRREQVPLKRKRATRPKHTGSDSDADEDGEASSGRSSEAEYMPRSQKTKSGRKVQKPAPFATVPSAPQAGKRRENQHAAAAAKKQLQLIQDSLFCKVCERGHSPRSNLIVFCDGCNTTYHQLCHKPVVDDILVTLPDAEWFCSICDERRRKEPLRLGSRADALTEEQKRTYLASLPVSHLVQLVMHADAEASSLALFSPDVVAKLTEQHVKQEEARERDRQQQIKDGTLLTGQTPQKPQAQSSSKPQANLSNRSSQTSAEVLPMTTEGDSGPTVSADDKLLADLAQAKGQVFGRSGPHMIPSQIESSHAVNATAGRPLPKEDPKQDGFTMQEPPGVSFSCTIDGQPQRPATRFELSTSDGHSGGKASPARESDNRGTESPAAHVEISGAVEDSTELGNDASHVAQATTENPADASSGREELAVEQPDNNEVFDIPMIDADEDQSDEQVARKQESTSETMSNAQNELEARNTPTEKSKIEHAESTGTSAVAAATAPDLSGAM
ncbi:hypothetical protein PYCC9005_000779 [Savitreella phatthalungensis]